MTIQEALAEAKALLRSPCPQANIENPSLDAALLLAEALKCSREELIVKANEKTSEADRENLLHLIERRRNGECIAYILGRREFRGLEFAVNSNVLVPRPDTETLVEAAQEQIDLIAGQDRKLAVLDLCTGSGAVAISLKNERPFLEVSASDISAEALEVAVQNAHLLEIYSHKGTSNLRFATQRVYDEDVTTVRFIKSDLFENIKDKFDIIVSDPPYIPSGELSKLAPEIRLEPRLALDGGEDGLEIIRKIISQASDHLLDGGVLLLEAAPEQMPGIKALFESHCFSGIKTYKDLAGRERVISAKTQTSRNLLKS